MKLVLNGTQEFELKQVPFLTSGDTIHFTLDVEDPSLIPAEIKGKVVLKDQIVWPKTTEPVEEASEGDSEEAKDEKTKEAKVEEVVEETEPEPEDFIFFETNAEDWLRYYVSGTTLYFSNIPAPPKPTEEEIEAQRVQRLNSEKERLIAGTKTALAEYLAIHPLTWIDGKQYSVTEDKQNLLTSNIALHQLSAAAGIPHELKWNTTGGVCTVWTIEELSALAIAIGNYVQPFVSYQQTIEVKMKECSTIKELHEISVDYDSVNAAIQESSGDGATK